jgi:molybdopterin synthase catalytic subunit
LEAIAENEPGRSGKSGESGQIDYIELSHYAGMTEAMCEQIVAEAKQRCDIDAVQIVHRVGKLYAGDQIVFVAVASRHRDEAFLASQFIMDYLKTRATIWKKEVGTRGQKWLGVKDKDEYAAKRWIK